MKRLTINYPDGTIQGAGTLDEILLRLAAYENTGLEPEEIKRLIETNETHMRKHTEMWKDLEKYLKAEAEGRLFVIPWATDIMIERDGLLYKGDHWNPPILTGFADDLTTRTGKRVCLFSVEDVKYAEAAKMGGADE